MNSRLLENIIRDTCHELKIKIQILVHYQKAIDQEMNRCLKSILLVQHTNKKTEKLYTNIGKCLVHTAIKVKIFDFLATNLIATTQKLLLLVTTSHKKNGNLSDFKRAQYIGQKSQSYILYCKKKEKIFLDTFENVMSQI